jgi:hypothetical protein
MKRAKGKSNIDILRDYVDGVRPFTQVGYVGEKHKHRKEGEQWKDKSGIEWQRKDGQNVRLTKTQGDIIREAIKDGQKCKCGQDIRWGSKLDQYFFARTGLCEGCLINYETNLRILGIYDKYERYKLISYELGRMEEGKAKIEDVIKFFSNSDGDVEMICNSEGFIERWKTTNKDDIVVEAKNDLQRLNGNIEKMKSYRDEAKQLYADSVKPYNLEAYV